MNDAYNERSDLLILIHIPFLMEIKILVKIITYHVHEYGCHIIKININGSILPSFIIVTLEYCKGQESFEKGL